MSETHEIAEKIAEADEPHVHHHLSPDAFRRRMGLVIGVLACALAITSVGASKAMQETINANIEASDDYAFYQAKLLRKQIVQSAADALDTLLATTPSLAEETKSLIHERREAYDKQMAHWDSAPDDGNGIKELLAKAKAATARREHENLRNDWFEFAEAMLQISVVIASTSVLLASRPLALTCLGFALIGVAFSLNGFFSLL